MIGSIEINLASKFTHFKLYLLLIMRTKEVNIII